MAKNMLELEHRVQDIGEFRNIAFIIYRKLHGKSRVQKCVFILYCLLGYVQPTGCFSSYDIEENNK